MLTEFATNIDTNLPTISDVEYRLTNYNDLLQDFNQLQKTVEEKCDETDLETHYETRKQFKTSFYDNMAILRNYMNKNTNNVTNDTASPNSNQSFDYTQNNFLPKIKLPSYKGDYESWLNFKTNFLAIVHNNPAINKANKYNFLRTSLEGYAKQIIDGIDFVEDQYETAWSTLCARFDKKRILANNHVKSIFQTESISKESAQAYRKLLDETATHLAALKNLKLTPEESSDMYLIYLITSKLDSNLQKKWEEFEPKADLPTLKEFFEFLNKKARGTRKLKADLPTLKEFFEFLNKKADALENWQKNQTKAQYPNSSYVSNKKPFNQRYPVNCNLASLPDPCGMSTGKGILIDLNLCKDGQQEFLMAVFVLPAKND
uniref:Uncharacterized protein LOC114339173 n=1 Tax=Diabrotica virgifera virgifera TaxID=50390 RepID=A0A6P7GK62_DIAVI